MQEKQQTAGTDKKGWGRRHSPVPVRGEGEWEGLGPSGARKECAEPPPTELALGFPGGRAFCRCLIERHFLPL